MPGTDALARLLAIAQQAHICLAIEGARNLAETAVPKTAAITFGDFLRQTARRHSISVIGRAVHIRAEPQPARTWLNVKLDLCTRQRMDVLLVSNMALFCAFMRRIHPRGGVAGDVPGTHEEVGPYNIRGKPLRAILDRLITDLEDGGAWVVRDVRSRKEQPTGIVWTVLPYSTPVTMNLISCELRP